MAELKKMHMASLFFPRQSKPIFFINTCLDNRELLTTHKTWLRNWEELTLLQWLLLVINQSWFLLVINHSKFIFLCAYYLFPCPPFFSIGDFVHFSSSVIGEILFGMCWSWCFLIFQNVIIFTKFCHCNHVPSCQILVYLGVEVDKITWYRYASLTLCKERIRVWVPLHHKDAILPV